MGTCYRAILVDGFDWEYENYSKEQAAEDVKRIIPHAEFVEGARNLLIVDTGKTNPVALVGNVKVDEIYYIDDNEHRIKKAGGYHGSYSKK